MSAFQKPIERTDSDPAFHDFIIVDWQDGAIVVLDQRRLPTEETYLRLTTLEDVAEAIKNMTVRGAPAIGVAAALGLALAAQRSTANEKSLFLKEMRATRDILAATRPTAVNLTWALDRMIRHLESLSTNSVADLKTQLLDEALRIKHQDIENNKAMGRHGQTLLQDHDVVLTHCNAGALATAGFGTALGVIYAAVEAGKRIQVIADETRPLLQGARLSAWELNKSGIPTTVITDSMAASLMQAGLIKKVLVGADRIAANGDAANKIGTYGLAVLAKYHGIPFYVVAPVSTIDFTRQSGKDIPIEERHAMEIQEFAGKRVVPQGVSIKNPAFDVTPSHLITAIVTEFGIHEQPLAASLQKLSKIVRQF